MIWYSILWYVISKYQILYLITKKIIYKFDIYHTMSTYRSQHNFFHSDSWLGLLNLNLCVRRLISRDNTLNNIFSFLVRAIGILLNLNSCISRLISRSNGLNDSFSTSRTRSDWDLTKYGIGRYKSFLLFFKGTRKGKYNIVCNQI